MIQLETKKLALMLCGLVLLGLGLFVFGAFGERTSHAVTSPFVKIWRKASDSKDAAAEWVDAETAAKDKKIRELEEKVLELQLQVGDARDLRTESGFRLGLPETKAAVALFPLAALLKQIDTLKALQDVTPGRNLAGTSQTAMLTHFFFSCSKN